MWGGGDGQGAIPQLSLRAGRPLHDGHRRWCVRDLAPPPLQAHHDTDIQSNRWAFGDPCAAAAFPRTRRAEYAAFRKAQGLPAHPSEERDDGAAMEEEDDDEDDSDTDDDDEEEEVDEEVAAEEALAEAAMGGGGGGDIGGVVDATDGAPPLITTAGAAVGTTVLPEEEEEMVYSRAEDGCIWPMVLYGDGPIAMPQVEATAADDEEDEDGLLSPCVGVADLAHSVGLHPLAVAAAALNRSFSRNGPLKRSRVGGGSIGGVGIGGVGGGGSGGLLTSTVRGKPPLIGMAAKIVPEAAMAAETASEASSAAAAAAIEAAGCLLRVLETPATEDNKDGLCGKAARAAKAAVEAAPAASGAPDDCWSCDSYCWRCSGEGERDRYKGLE